VVNFTNLAATAKRLVEANGRTVTLYKENRDPDNAAEPWRGTSTAPDAGQGGDTQTGIVAFVPAGESGLGRLASDSGGGLQVQLDQVGLLAATTVPGVDVEVFDRMLDADGVHWKIVTREKLQPATTAVLWVLGLKR